MSRGSTRATNAEARSYARDGAVLSLLAALLTPCMSGQEPTIAAREALTELLLIHGTADVNAPFSTSMRMVKALVDADKPFELLVLPGATHSFQGKQAAYASKWIRTFFLEHLRREVRRR